MRKSEFTPPHIQKAIDAKERLLKARASHTKEKAATEKLDIFYLGAATDHILNMDTKEINSFMELV